MTCTTRRTTFSQAELDANGSPTAASGVLYNFVTASSNEAPDATDDLSIPISQEPALTVVKSSTTSSLSAPATVDYSYVVTNTGNVGLTGISLSDDNDNDDMDCPATTLAVGADMTCSATHTFSQAELDANGSPTAASGVLYNLVTASSNEAPDATDDLSIPISQEPALTVVKSSTTSSLSAPATVDYSYVVTNTGNVGLTGISLSDDNDNDDMDCPATTLAVGADMTCSATHTFSQAELDANGSPTAASGVLYNLVTASSNEAPDATDDLSIPISQEPALTVVKSSTTSSLSAPATVDYSYVVTNTGNVGLTGISLSDDNDNDDMDCPATTLAVGADMTCSATHTFSQAELDANGSPTAASGVLYNFVTASSNEAPDATDDLSIPISQYAELKITKSADPSFYNAVGDLITYTITATNTGAATLTNVDVSDALIDGLGSWECTPPDGSTLAPGESIVCTATYSITADDLEAGQVDNTACVVSDELAEHEPPICDSETVLRSDLEIVKEADVDYFSAAGDLIHYTITATNTGEITLQNVDISDALIDGVGDWTCTPNDGSDLAPTESIVCTATYEVTAADVEAGSVPNTACAVSDETPEVCDDLDIPLAELNIVKSANVSTYSAVGDEIVYTVTATNTGEATLTKVDISDALIDGLADWTCKVGDATVTMPVAQLSSGQAITCTATYAVTAADMEAGSVFNQACVDSDETPEVCDDVDIPLAKLEIVKSANVSTFSAIGDQIVYTITATNTGEATLSNVDISDALIDGLDSWACVPEIPATLGAGEAITCTATYAVTATDMAAGSVFNQACVDSDETPAVCDDVDIPLAQLEIVKSADVSTFSAIGDPIVYTITATNTGEATLSNVDISDALIDGLDSWACVPEIPATLGAGEAITCTATYAVTAADMAAGSVFNQACVDSDETPEVCDEIDILGPIAISIVKTASDVAVTSGDTVTFTLEFGHDQSFPLYLVSLDDDIYGDMLDASNPNIVAGTNTCANVTVGYELEVGATYRCQFDAVITGDPGFIHRNVMTIKATDVDPLGPESENQRFAESSDDAAVEVIPVKSIPTPTPKPSTSPQPETNTLLATDTTAGGDAGSGLGDPITWAIWVLLSVLLDPQHRLRHPPAAPRGGE